MADKFDISQHINIEALGYRSGISYGLGTMYVNGKAYAEADFTVTPTAITPTTLNSLMNSQQSLYGSDYKNVYVGSAEFHSSPSSPSYIYWDTITSQRTYYIYIKDISGGFNVADDPKTSGTLFATVNYPSPDPIPTYGFRGFNPPYGKYQVSVYAGTSTLIGKFISHVYQPQFDPFEWIGVSADNSFSAYVESVTNNTGVTRDYSIYINNVLTDTVTVPNGSSDVLPAIPPALDTFFNVKVVRDDAVVVTERNNVKVRFRDGYNNVIPSGANWPNNPYGIVGPDWAEIPARFNRLTSSTAELFWNIEILPEAITNWPSGATPNNYRVKLYGSDGSFKYYQVPANTTSDQLAVRAENFYLELPGLDTDNVSYLAVILFQDPTTAEYFDYYEVEYGNNAPARPATDPIPVVAFGWWPIECAVAECNIESSYNVDKGLLKTPEVGKCDLSMKGSEADPRVNTALQLDNKIRVKLAAAASPDGTEDYLFSGFIANMSTTYDTYGNSNTNLSAVDAMSRVLNVNIPVYEYTSTASFGQRMFDVFEDYIAPATWGVSYDDSLWSVFSAYDRSVFPEEYRENVSASEIISELTEGEYAVMGQNRGGVIFWFNRSVPALIYAANEDLLTEPGYIGFSTQHNATSLDHFCISDFTISNNIEDITNQVIASLSYDELTTETYEDTNSIAIYGKRSYDVQLNLDAPSGDAGLYLRRWIEEVPYFEDRSEIESVTADVVNRLGLVTRAYQVDPLVDPVRVFIQTGPVDINGIWFAKRVVQKITPESWYITLDLTAD